MWGSAGPSWRTRRHAGFRGARPPRAPSRPGHLHPAPGAHPCSAARSSRPLPAHGAPRPWVPGARAQQAPRQRGPPGSQPPPSRGEQGREASPPSSLLRLCRRSGPGALRLRTFHSSFHAPSAGQPLIGSAEPDVNTSWPHRPRPSPFPGGAGARNWGAPPGGNGEAGRNHYICVLMPSLLLPHPLQTPTCHLQSIAICGFDPYPHSFCRSYTFHFHPRYAMRHEGGPGLKNRKGSQTSGDSSPDCLLSGGYPLCFLDSDPSQTVILIF